MNELDLNIKNYNLTDILNLFNLSPNFDETGLKNAKKQVLMTHPDKSHMEKEYFLFFSSAYRLLYKVYKFRTRSEQDTTVNRHYHAEDVDCDEDNADVWNTLSKHKEFNVIFNKMFEKTLADEQPSGYGDWLKEEDENVTIAKNRNEMNNLIDERKKKLRSLVPHKDISDAGGVAGADLLDNGGNYSSNMFSSLQYDDLKQAYTESVVPVSIEDFENRESYKSVDNIKSARLAQDKIRPNYKEQISKYERDQEDDAARAFSLAKQDEKMRIIRSKMASNFLRITK